MKGESEMSAVGGALIGMVNVPFDKPLWVNVTRKTSGLIASYVVNRRSMFV